MPQRDPWISDMHSWDERIGPDSSITHVGGGKKIFPDTSGKFASNIPLPQGDQPFLVPMPKNGEHRGQQPVVVNTDTHVWRSYRSVISGEGTAGEGKKMHARPLPMIQVQAHMRKCLREKLRDQERRELLMFQQNNLEREALLRRHTQHAEMEESFFRKRAATLGFEGLRKPVTRPPPPPPAVTPDDIERAVGQACAQGAFRGAGSGGGKRVWRNHPSQRNNGAPFGGLASTPSPQPGGDERPTPSMQRWEDKSLF